MKHIIHNLSHTITISRARMRMLEVKYTKKASNETLSRRGTDAMRT